MFSFLSSLIFGSGGTVETLRLDAVPPFSRLILEVDALSDLPEDLAHTLVDHIVYLTEARGAVFVSPSAFSGHEAWDSEFHPDSIGWAFIRGTDRASTVEIDFSAVPASTLQESSVHEALLVLLAYPSIVRVIA